tara:strand:- start:57 stop:446 length:390 start_codon:yes stop_codon:yes gene_type:complete
MAELSISSGSKSKEEIEAKAAKHAEHLINVKDEKFKFLTEKYLNDILAGIERAAKKGYREKYMNFDREDFKANCKGLGYPNEFQRMWLDEVSKPTSSYIFKDEDEVPRCLEGIEANIWNNSSFTTVFKW